MLTKKREIGVVSPFHCFSLGALSWRTFLELLLTALAAGGCQASLDPKTSFLTFLRCCVRLRLGDVCATPIFWKQAFNACHTTYIYANLRLSSHINEVASTWV
ncbi:MAG: hypothetical protein SNH94_02410 [Rikenellaceae bacterium]